MSVPEYEKENVIWNLLQVFRKKKRQNWKICFRQKKGADLQPFSLQTFSEKMYSAGISAAF